MSGKIAVVLGTRPEIIKMSPVIKRLADRNVDFFLIHTGQHYSYELDRVFFEQLGLPAAKYNLEAGSGSHAEQTAKILLGVEKLLLQERPALVLVEGDTNSVLAGALAAVKLHIKVGHIEAGLRSYDRRMPEEINRVLADRISDLLFAPTEKAKSTLISEGIPEDKVFVTGNSVVDAVYQNMPRAKKSHARHNLPRFNPQGYFLATLHREENVDDPARLHSIIQGLDSLVSAHHLPVIFPVHPRAQKRLGEFLVQPKNLTLVPPVDYLTFLRLESDARLVLTDSGGVQEESCILGVPCVTLRDNTERPETLEVGANMLAGADSKRILECAEIMLAKRNGWKNPFGDGKAADRIVNIITGGVDV